MDFGIIAIVPIVSTGNVLGSSDKRLIIAVSLAFNSRLGSLSSIIE